MKNDISLCRAQNDFAVDYINCTGFNSPNMHCHTYSELLIVLRGNLNFLVDDAVYHAQDSCLIFFKEKQFHTTDVDSTNPYTRYNITFRYKYLNHILDYECVRELYEQESTVIPLNEAVKKELLAFAEPLYKYTCTAKPDPQLTALARHMLCALLIRVNLLVKEKTVRRAYPVNTYINHVLDYIKIHLTEKLLVEDIASAFYVSRSKLMSDFKSATGITIGDYILCNRIKTAKELLMSGRNVSDTAVLSGFVNTSHFIRAFKKQTGQTPLQYCRSKM